MGRRSSTFTIPLLGKTLITISPLSSSLCVKSNHPEPHTRYLPKRTLFCSALLLLSSRVRPTPLLLPLNFNSSFGPEMSPFLDRISSLPDELICEILSLLPTHEAVATSVLSKRWIPLWRYLSVINLANNHIARSTYSRTVNFVSSVLMFRDRNVPIKKFSLRLSHDDRGYKFVNTWVTIVLRRQVEYLYLDLRNEMYLNDLLSDLPIGILNCRTLVFLDLRGLLVKQNVPSVHLPLLKTLHMVTLHFDQNRYLLQLLSGCPNLETFQAIDVQSEVDDSSEKFKGLTKLIRAHVRLSSTELMWGAFYNVEYLFMDLNGVSLDCDKIPAFHNLTHMRLIFDDKYNWQWLKGLLHNCPKLQMLVLGVNTESYRFGSDDDVWVYPEFVPECVLLHLRKCSISKYKGMKGELQFASYIMQNASVLQAMKIHSSRSCTYWKLKMNEELSLCEKRSATCQFSFD